MRRFVPHHVTPSCALGDVVEGFLLLNLPGMVPALLVVLLGEHPVKGWAGQDRACCKGAAPMSKSSRLKSHPQAHNNLIKCLLE